MKYLTGNKDLDMEIILNLRDDEIEPVCNVNKYVKDICESEIFWYRRIAKRIEYAKNENRKIYKELADIPINGERISQMKEFFGFKKLKELNDYLNKFLPKALYQIYYDYNEKDNYINELYVLDKKLLPKYIDYDELIYEIRRQLIFNVYEPRNHRESKNINLYLKTNTPGATKKDFDTMVALPTETFSLFKKLEII